jgi:GAG-pre-integrase domain
MTASIAAVENNISVSLYAAVKPHWMMDSGATYHIMPHKSDFKDYTLTKGTVCLGDKSTTDQIGIGTAVFKSPQNTEISLSNMLHIPDVHTHFLSTGAICDKDAKIVFNHKGFQILKDQQCVATGYQEDKLYWLDGSTASLNTHIRSNTAPLHIWHQQIGHMSHAVIKKHSPSALKNFNLDQSDTIIPSICTGYEAGKSTQKPFPTSIKKSDQILEIIHSNLASPMQTKFLQGSFYITTFIDDYLCHVVVYYI